jgi:hypothetical protein
MRALLTGFTFCVLALLPAPGNAENRLPQPAVSGGERQPPAKPNGEAYRGHFLDVSDLAGRQNLAKMTDALRHQIDIVEDVAGLSPRMMNFFRSIPVLVSEVACLNPTKDKDGKDLEDPRALLHPACYAMEPPETSRSLSYGSVWDGARSRWSNPDPVALGIDTNLGVIMVRPIMLDASSSTYARPVLLHELLHAYHNCVMPRGYKNAGILINYNRAKQDSLYPAESYLMTNEREFFAVTGSVFLYGNDGPITRSMIKEKQPDYYKYLVFLFGFDPDPPPSVAPLASAQ